VKERRAAVVNRAENSPRVAVAQNASAVQRDNALAARQVQQQKVVAERAEAKQTRAREARPRAEDHQRGKGGDKSSSDR
jgi:hypothetical protein